MTTYAYVVINDKVGSRFVAKEYIDLAPEGSVVTIKDADRTLEQNSAQWPYLAGFAEQMQWPVNGQMVHMTMEEWKDVLTAAFEGDVNPKIAAGWEGGMVMLGRRTSKFGKKKFSEWMEWLVAAAAMKGVTPIYKNPPKE